MRASGKRKYIRLGLGLFWLVVLGWMWLSMQATGVKDTVLRSNDDVFVVESSDVITFAPRSGIRRAGFVFLPGGLVDPHAYASMARAIAEAGHLVYLVKLPFRTAPFETHQTELRKRVQTLMAAEPAVDHWMLGGHSRGGALAARFAESLAPEIKGLILVGTSHPRKVDLSDSQLDVTKIYASNDGLASVEEVREFANLLPADTRWVLIQGGNHAQFGRYRNQIGDGRASISHDEQQELTVDAILEALARVDGSRDAGEVFADPLRFEKEIQEFERRDAQSPPPDGAILFVGSSSIRLWHQTLESDMAPLTVIPRGFGGSTMPDVLHFADRIVLPYRPRAIVLYEGDNDIGEFGAAPDRVAALFEEFVADVHAQSPGTRIYYLSIKPSPSRWQHWPNMAAANTRIRRITDGNDLLYYVDVASPLLDSAGNPRDDVFVDDQLHLNRRGYVEWVKTLKPLLMTHELDFENKAME